MAPIAQLAVEVNLQKVIVHIVITNPSNTDALFLDKSKIVAAAPPRAKLFRVQCEDKEVPYTGALAKRKAPTREDFFRVAPGAEIKGFADISDVYAFLPGKHRYTIEYRAFHGDPDDPAKLVEILSKPTAFELQR